MLKLNYIFIIQRSIKLPDNKTSHSIKKFTQVGILVHSEETLQHLPDKDAILVLSFGTAQKESRENSIENIVKKIEIANPKVNVALAFTSNMIIRKLKKDGLYYDTAEEAMEKLLAAGHTRIALVSLDIIPGIEYCYKQDIFHHYKHRCKKLTLGTPLLYWMGQQDKPDDIKDILESFFHNHPAINDKFDAILLFTHGTLHPANAYYAVMQQRLKTMGKGQIFLYTGEGHPELTDVIPILQKNNYKNILLLPFLVVAGLHVYEDMSGSSDSHKAKLEQAGFNVTAYMHGLGEDETITNFFVQHAQAAYDILLKN